ncbi:hypothetical protein MSAN_02350400 [Mycena sanguinolenta]|uniref:Uncharacterized protein n=1 Tax=Mycena sanguinolenta TaxID=230812 RepID=A0A8H7CGK4_9AGAR|nr:hypothetical protein MSAN_02350400 [Mycena sanguinolenta]
MSNSPPIPVVSDNSSEPPTSVPSTPEPTEKHKKHYRGGYKTAPKATPYKPYALNNTGTLKQAALELNSSNPLVNRDSLDPWEWNDIAVLHKLIPAGALLHSFQISAANRALS